MGESLIPIIPQPKRNRSSVSHFRLKETDVMWNLCGGFTSAYSSASWLDHIPQSSTGVL